MDVRPVRRATRAAYRGPVTGQQPDSPASPGPDDGGPAGGDDPFAALGALFGGGGGMEGLLAQAQQMQSDLADTQRRLADTRVSGTSGGGLVRATVTGDRELVELTIDRAAVDPDDPETLADLVVAAVRAANEHARTVAEQAMAGAVPDLSALGAPTGDAGASGAQPGAFGGFAGLGGFGPSLPGGAAAASAPPVVPGGGEPHDGGFHDGEAGGGEPGDSVSDRPADGGSGDGGVRDRDV